MTARATVTPTESPVKQDLDLEPAHLEDRIRRRAYEVYLQRDGEGGTALDDWLQAETEITHTVEQNYIRREEADANARGE